MTLRLIALAACLAALHGYSPGAWPGGVARDMDGDGDPDFVSTRGNSSRYDGVF